MFSVIICTYNGERTLSSAINAVLTQKDYKKYISEFIVVDNASSDKTKEVINSYVEHGVIYSFESKPGLSNARLNGVRIAKDDWIVFLDDDNEIDENWISNAADYIQKNNEICIFGGSIIPKLEFCASEEELKRLEKYKGMLACTDFRREDIDLSRTRSPLGTTVGAGMIVEARLLKIIADGGWLKQSGRLKNSTASGEDGEIRQRVLKISGKKEGHCPLMIIYHNLDHRRLQKEYLLKLCKSITESSYTCQSMENLFVFRRIKTLIGFLISKCPYEKDSFDYEMWRLSHQTYIYLVRKDFLVLR